ncbi:MAG: aldehyde dehydrogenase family protein, partial [Amphritea sp.]
MNGKLQPFNPADHELAGEVETSSSEQNHQVIDLARSAQPAWQRLDFRQRAEKMQQAADALLEKSEQLGTQQHREMGKPLSSAIGEVRFCARGISKKTAEVEQVLKPEFLDDGQTVTEISYEPYGVCAAITPWNYPILRQIQPQGDIKYCRAPPG